MRWVATLGTADFREELTPEAWYLKIPFVGDLANRNEHYRLWSGTTKQTKEGVRNDQTAFDQRFSHQSRTTHASGREAYKAYAQLMASGGTAPELLW